MPSDLRELVPSDSRSIDDAQLEEACIQIVEAAAELSDVLPASRELRRAARARLASSAALVAPSLVKQVRAISAKNARLLREARLEPEDVAQEVLRRLIESPPRNPEGRDPVAAVLGWARAVANNVMLDRRRRAGWERPEPRGGEEEEPRAPSEAIDPERAAEDVLEVLAEIERMRVEAEHLASYKYLRETFRVLVKEPDVPALELAQRVGLIEPPPAEPAPAEYVARSRRAAQYAWKLRQRMLDLLAARLGGRRSCPVEKS
jgi:DNA-directed RNA polymerase specialized sigma24 family protein